MDENENHKKPRNGFQSVACLTAVGDAGQSCAQSGGKVPYLPHSWLYSGGPEQRPGALHTMASIKQHHQRHCYLLLPPRPSPGAIRLANLEGGKTT